MISVGIVLLVLISVLTLGTLLINLLLSSAPRRGKRPDVANDSEDAAETRGVPSGSRYFSSEVDFYLRDWLDGEASLTGRADDEARFYRFVGALLEYYPARSEVGAAPARPEPSEVERKIRLACKDANLLHGLSDRKRLRDLARRVQVIYDFVDAHESAGQTRRRPHRRGRLPSG